MDRAVIVAALADIVSRNKNRAPGAEPLNEDSFLGGDLGLDSVEILELIVDVQKQLSVVIPKEDLGELYTVRDIVELVIKNRVQ